MTTVCDSDTSECAWDNAFEAHSLAKKHSAFDIAIGEPAFRQGISAAALMSKPFEPATFVVSGLISEGVTLLGGKPKIGKSWLVLDLALAVASGQSLFGSTAVEQGDVLYIALEDNQRRLKSRLVKKGVQDPPERLLLATEWPDLDAGCIPELEAWVAEAPSPRLIIIDVLKMVRPKPRPGEQPYDADYRALTGLGQFARQHGVAVLVVHHVRKMEADDPLESLSGTNGLTGAADAVMVLKRDNGTGNATLYVRGRDVEENETTIRFNRQFGTWELLGRTEEVGRTSERQEVLNVLRMADKPLTAREVSDRMGKNYDAVRRTLVRMSGAGEIEKPGRGLYACLNSPNVPSGPYETVETHGTGYEYEGLNYV